MHLVFRARVAIFLLATAVPLAVQAQKKALTQADWDRWQTIASPTLSPDGKWAAYTLNPRLGDGEFIVRATGASSEYRVNVGYTNRENNIPGAERGRGGAAGGAPPAGGGGRGGRGGPAGPNGLGPFSADGKFAVVLVNQPLKTEVDSVERVLRGRGTRTPNAPAGPITNSLRVVRLADGNVEAITGARSFRLPDANGKWLAYSMVDSAAAAAAAGAAGGRGGRGAGGRGAAAAAEVGAAGAPGANGAVRRTYGTPLVLRNLDSGAEERLADVTQYTFDDSAKVLAYTVTSHDSTMTASIFATSPWERRARFWPDPATIARLLSIARSNSSRSRRIATSSAKRTRKRQCIRAR